MTDTSTELLPARERSGHRLRWIMRALAGDPMAVAATIWLVIVVLAMLADAFSLLGENRISLKARNLPPFDFSQTWTLWFGADALGRPLLVRLIQAASTTIGIALVTVLTSLVGGTLLGVIAGYSAVSSAISSCAFPISSLVSRRCSWHCSGSTCSARAC